MQRALPEPGARCMAKIKRCCPDKARRIRTRGKPFKELGLQTSEIYTESSEV